jgi:hypothetical protein
MMVIKHQVVGSIPSCLSHPYSQVVCKNKGELLYVLEWAKREGKMIADYMWKVEKFPYHLFLAGQIVGWTDLTDRIGEKVSFEKFCSLVNWA